MRRRVMLATVLSLAMVSSVLASGASAGVNSISTVDADFAGFPLSIEMVLDANGNPAMTYRDQQTDELVLVRCNDSGCTGQDESVIRSGNVRDPIIAIRSDNRPAIGYGTKSGAFVTEVCITSTCEGEVVRAVLDQVEPSNDFPLAAAIALDENDHVIAVWNQLEPGLHFARCLDTVCNENTGRVVRNLDPGTVVITEPDIVLDRNGHPVIAYSTEAGTTEIIQCNSDLCRLDSLTRTSISTGVDYIVRPSIDLVDQADGSYDIVVAAIEIIDADNVPFGVRELSLFQCSSPDCPGSITKLAGPPTNNSVPANPELVMTDDGPVIAYLSLRIEGKYRVMITSPTVGEQLDGVTAEWVVVSPDAPTEDIVDFDFEITDDGEAVLATLGADGLKVIHCDDIGCVPTCNGLPVTVDIGAFGKGTSGRDVMRGTAGNDSIAGGPGGDVICGLGGDDYIEAGDGWDRVFAGAGNDRVLGDGGNDRIVGGPGADNISGGDGNDRLIGGAGDDALEGDGGNDSVSGGGGNDDVSGGDGADELFGNLGRDTMRGGGGSDIIRGGGWVDSVDGGQGEDRCGIVAGEIRNNCERGVFGA